MNGITVKLPPGPGCRGYLIIILPDVSPTSVADILRGLAHSAVVWNSRLGGSSLRIPATDIGETSKSRSSRLRPLRPEGILFTHNAHEIFNPNDCPDIESEYTMFLNA